MHFVSILSIFICWTFVHCETSEKVNDDYTEGTSLSDVTTTANDVTTTEVWFSEMPENIQIVYVDPTTFIKFDNKGEHVMGLSDEHCDNGRVGIIILLYPPLSPHHQTYFSSIFR